MSDYECFLRSLLKRLNLNRSERFLEEVKCLKPLPASKLPGYTTIEVRVGPSSTIRVAKNTYSVHSRLIGETITARNLKLQNVDLKTGLLTIRRRSLRSRYSNRKSAFSCCRSDAGGIEIQREACHQESGP